MPGFENTTVVASVEFTDARTMANALLELLEQADSLDRNAICYVDTPLASFGTGIARLLERTLTDDSKTYDIELVEQ